MPRRFVQLAAFLTTDARGLANVAPNVGRAALLLRPLALLFVDGPLLFAAGLLIGF